MNEIKAFRDEDNYILNEDGKFIEFSPEEVKLLTSLYLEDASKHLSIDDEIKITYNHPDGKSKIGIAINLDPENPNFSVISNFIELENGDVQDICSIIPTTNPTSGVLLRMWKDECSDAYTHQDFIKTYEEE